MTTSNEVTDRDLMAYYYSFEPTGVIEIDRILAAVASAGDGSHHTESWNEHGLVIDIQEKANAAAAAWNRRTPTAAIPRTSADAIFSWHESMRVVLDPDMPPGTIELRSGKNVVRGVNFDTTADTPAPADSAALESVHARFLAAVAASNGDRVPLDICHVPDSDGRMVWATMQDRDYVDCIGSTSWTLTSKGRDALGAARWRWIREADWDEIKSAYWNNGSTREECMVAMDSYADQAIAATSTTGKEK